MQIAGSARKNLNFTDKAYYTIKNMIIRGQLEPGSVVSVLSLSELLNIGRTPVTMACQRLEVDGLVRIVPKQGVLITPMSPTEVRELYEARLAIELFSADKAFDYLTPADIDVLEESILRQKSLGENKDAYGFMEEDTFFHRYILTRYPNKIIAGMLDNLIDRIFLIGVKNSSDSFRLNQAIESHLRMVEALRLHNRKAFLSEIELNQMSGYIYNTGLYNRK